MHMPFPAEVAFFVLYISFINLLFIFLFVANFFKTKKLLKYIQDTFNFCLDLHR